MKKLSKKFTESKGTLMAYACSCGTCSCGSCSCNSQYVQSASQNSAMKSAGSGSLQMAYAGLSIGY